MIPRDAPIWPPRRHEAALPKTQPIPAGHHTVTPHIVVRGGVAQAIEFYQRAFGAESRMQIPGPDSAIMHGQMRIGDSTVMLAPENENWGSKSPLTLGGTAVTLSLYVEKCDAAFERAVGAGAKPIMPPTDMFWGDRYALVSDPSGHVGAIASHVQDLTPEQIQANMKGPFGDKGCA